MKGEIVIEELESAELVIVKGEIGIEELADVDAEERVVEEVDDTASVEAAKTAKRLNEERILKEDFRSTSLRKLHPEIHEASFEDG